MAEAEVYRQFGELLAGRTALLISHRLGSARMADRILVLKDGRIVEQGPHDDLVAKGGVYAAMWEEQASWYQIILQDTTVARPPAMRTLLRFLMVDDPDRPPPLYPLIGAPVRHRSDAGRVSVDRAGALRSQSRGVRGPHLPVADMLVWVALWAVLTLGTIVVNPHLDPYPSTRRATETGDGGPTTRPTSAQSKRPAARNSSSAPISTTCCAGHKKQPRPAFFSTSSARSTYNNHRNADGRLRRIGRRGCGIRCS